LRGTYLVLQAVSFVQPNLLRQRGIYVCIRCGRKSHGNPTAIPARDPNGCGRVCNGCFSVDVRTNLTDPSRIKTIDQVRELDWFKDMDEDDWVDFPWVKDYGPNGALITWCCFARMKEWVRDMYEDIVGPKKALAVKEGKKRGPDWCIVDV